MAHNYSFINNLDLLSIVKSRDWWLINYTSIIYIFSLESKCKKKKIKFLPFCLNNGKIWPHLACISRGQPHATEQSCPLQARHCLSGLPYPPITPWLISQPISLITYSSTVFHPITSETWKQQTWRHSNNIHKLIQIILLLFHDPEVSLIHVIRGNATKNAKTALIASFWFKKEIMD